MSLTPVDMPKRNFEEKALLERLGVPIMPNVWSPASSCRCRGALIAMLLPAQMSTSSEVLPPLTGVYRTDKLVDKLMAYFIGPWCGITPPS